MPGSSATPRHVSRLLSGYLCGTHSGALARAGNRLGGVGAERVAAAHRALPRDAADPGRSELGGPVWVPQDRLVRDRLRTSLRHPAVLDLILFGSQARESVTGFSDVDAILVISDEAADDPRTLRSLRPRVLASQRAVLAHQPLQHHGFEVATPRLLVRASEALGLPAVALEETRSLYSAPVAASLANGAGPARESLPALTRAVASVQGWPRHVWRVHRLVAMFELLPTLYLQSRGRTVPKWQSFSEARDDFGASWWPYDVLQELRLAWPRQRRRRLELAALGVRNPWAAVAAWNRMSAPPPDGIRGVLSDGLLDGLRSIAHAMANGRE